MEDIFLAGTLPLGYSHWPQFTTQPSGTYLIDIVQPSMDGVMKALAQVRQDLIAMNEECEALKKQLAAFKDPPTEEPKAMPATALRSAHQRTGLLLPE